MVWKEKRLIALATEKKVIMFVSWVRSKTEDFQIYLADMGASVPKNVDTF
jgi:hypothetical protein